MAKKTKKYALGGQLRGRQAMTPRKPMGAPSGPPKSVPVRPMGPANTAMGPANYSYGVPKVSSRRLPVKPIGAPSEPPKSVPIKPMGPPSYADTMRTELKNPPRVTPEIQGMADMASAIARGPRPNPLNPTGSLNGPRFAGMGMKKGGSVSSASKRADGIAKQGKTKGKIC